MISPTHLLPVLAPVVGGTAVIAWRIQETRRPVSAPKIVIPPLGMSTGLSMFLVPEMRIPWTWGVAAFLLGAIVLSYPLVRSSSLERSGDEILMRRSKGFLVVLLGLLALRLALHEYVGQVLPAAQTAAVFFLLAFGMILRWRVGMYVRYRALCTESASGSTGEGRGPPAPCGERPTGVREPGS